MGDDHVEVPETAAGAAAARQLFGDGEATHAVADYVRRRFWLPVFRWDRSPDGVLRMDDSQWKTLRTMLERLYGLDDLNNAFQLVRGREFHALSHDYSADEDGLDESGYRAVDSSKDPALPNGWLTLLEAAYEQLDDVDGLERLYSYCILADLSPDGHNHADEDDCDDDGTEDEAVDDGVEAERHTYLDKLRNLVSRAANDNHEVAAERWSQVIEAIVAAFETADGMEYPVDHAHAYERLLIEEQLADAAWRYCERRIHDPWATDARSDMLISRFFDVIASSRASDACELLLKPLHDADSALMRDDSAEHRRDIVQRLERCTPDVGVDRVRNEARRLQRLYRTRRKLQESLEAFLNDPGISKA